MKKTKIDLIEELAALQQTTADERESLGKVLNEQQAALNWTRNELRDAGLMLESYEKTILVLTKRLTEARKALNTPADLP
jgi:septal ring factor EnvC (AmiA/AmiB activator)